MIFHVLVFDTSACEKVYPSFGFVNNEEDCKGSKEIKKRKYSDTRFEANAKNSTSFLALKPSYKKPRILDERTKASSIKSMDRGCNIKEERISHAKTTAFTHGDSYFYGTICPRHLKYNLMHLPIDFAKSSGLSEKAGQFVSLRYKNEGSWQVLLRQNKYNGQTSLGRGWKEFAVENSIKVGDEFKLEFVSEESTFFMNYHGSEAIKKRKYSNTRFEANAKRNPSALALKPSYMPRRLEERTKACSINGMDRNRIVEERTSRSKTAAFTHGDSYFYGTIRPSHLSHSEMNFPSEFARENGLLGKCCMMTLKNKNGVAWEVLLKHRMWDGRVYMGAGWKKFALENGLQVGDKYKLELVKSGKMPVMVMNYSGSEEIKKRNFLNTRFEANAKKSPPVVALKPSEKKSSILEVRTKACSIEAIDRSFIDKNEIMASKAKTITFTHADSYFCGTIHPSHLSPFQMKFPMKFARKNGLQRKCCNMILRNKGVAWQVLLKHKPSDGTVYIGTGWKEFAVENGLRVGDQFKLELIESGKMLVMNYYGVTDIGENTVRDLRIASD